MFLVNSRLNLFAATSSSANKKFMAPAEALLLPKLRSYFAEFLKEGYPDALVFSTCPPVSVYGTGTLVIH